MDYRKTAAEIATQWGPTDDPEDRLPERVKKIEAILRRSDQGETKAAESETIPPKDETPCGDEARRVANYAVVEQRRLIMFFREEAIEEGLAGDEGGLSPAECAIELIRDLKHQLFAARRERRSTEELTEKAIELGKDANRLAHRAADVAQAGLNQLAAAKAILDPLNRLRESEGASVLITCPNPEGPPNEAIEVSDDWTGWEDRRFAADTLAECLRLAELAKAAPKPEFIPPTESDKQKAIEWAESPEGKQILADERREFYLSLLPEIRQVARAAGYAIGVHGSLERDFDLIAVPWTDDALSDHALAHGIKAIVGGQIRPAFSMVPGDTENKNPGRKPHGRIVWTILLTEGANCKFIDLSVMPRAERDNRCPDCGRPFGNNQDVLAGTMLGKCFTRDAPDDAGVKEDCERAKAEAHR